MKTKTKDDIEENKKPKQKKLKDKEATGSGVIP
jgi:hypothetical protein